VSRRLRLGDIALGVIVTLVLSFLMAPALIVIPLSFAGDAMTRFPPERLSLSNYEAFFDGPGWLDSTGFSLRMAATVMVLAVVGGGLSAYGIMRLSRRWQRALSVLVLLPMLVPQIIYALAIYSLFASLGLLGTMTGFVIANLVLALPYAIITLRNGLSGFDWSLVRAASVLGARPLRVLVKVAMPLLAPTILSAALFSFLIAFDEVIVAQFIGSPFANPLPKRMWDGMMFRWDPTISAISTLQIAITVVVLAVLGIVRHRQSRLSGRRSDEQ
jgi:ABC-type spermidine/putrescine transport system permease subunit II